MRDVRRVVIKLGTAVLTDETESIDRSRLIEVARRVIEVRDRGIEVAMVSSGSIAAGMERLGLAERPREVELLQAVASVGQGILMGMYSDIFKEHGIVVGQVLLTQQDMTHRRQYLNAKNTFERLFSMGVLPIINENDTVATEEITLGDNDILAGLVTALAEADLLVMLTDTEGLFTSDPKASRDATLLREVPSITPQIESLGGASGSGLGSGGMSSKIQAAKIAVSAGADAVVAGGHDPRNIIEALDGGTPGTRFLAAERVSSKKHWIGYAKRSQGSLTIDDGAVEAIVRGGRSLLPAGVIGVDGEFKAGDCVDIVSTEGRLVGKGLVNYDAQEAEKIQGKRSDQVVEILGEEGEEMVHRDAMVVFK